MNKDGQRTGSSENAVRSRRLVCVVAVISLLSSGCYPVPVRSPTRTTDTSSNPIDLGFLKPGETTRDEVAAKLSAVSTNATQEDFFWGRPRVSKYRQIIMVGYVPIGPGDRMWGVQNLLVAYGQHGMVKSWTLVGDKELFEQLDLLSGTATSPPVPTSLVLPDSVIYRLHGKHVQPGAIGSAQLSLSPDSVECFGVKIARSDVRSIALTNSGASDHLSLKMFFTHSIDFTSSPLHKRTDHIDLSVDPQNLLLLRHYMKQSASAK